MTWPEKALLSTPVVHLPGVKMRTKVLTNPHFWAIAVITLFLVFVYQAWPWRPWQFGSGVWQWFFWLSFLSRFATVEFINHMVGILFLVPIIYSAVVFSWQGVLVTSVITIVSILPTVVGMWSFKTILSNTVLLLMPFLVVSIMVFEMGWRMKMRMIYTERQQEHKIYTLKVLEAQEGERKRIAQELHDDIIQRLLVMANSAQTLSSSDTDDMDVVKKDIGWIGGGILEAADSLRRMSIDLRPSILDELGLIPALRWLLDRMSKESGIEGRIHVEGKEPKLSYQEETSIFRVVQESLRNIERHSGATEVSLTIAVSDDRLRILIQDNGSGFQPSKNLGEFVTGGKLGLVGMRERIESLRGTLEIQSRPGEGTLLLIEINLSS
jgi:two-component system sensor histidine kinase DegS